MSRVWHEKLLAPGSGGQHVLLASTIYDRPDVCLMSAVASSVSPLRDAGIGLETLFLEGDCHVDDARNSVVSHFLESDCTDLVFLDADVAFNPGDLLAIITTHGDVVGGVYPHRKVWADHDKKMPIRFGDGGREVNEHGALAVEGLPTGFMRIGRHVIETLSENANIAETANNGTFPILFERGLISRPKPSGNGVIGRRVSGDIAFCAKAIDAGFGVFALPEMMLGHKASTVVRDSLGAMMRRQAGTTLRYVAQELRAGSTDVSLFKEARVVAGNPLFGMDDGGLLACVALARKSDGPIVEAGSGLSSVLMAAANPKNTVWCLENERRWKDATVDMARVSGVENIALVSCGIRDEWYSIADPIPSFFGLGVADGPQRKSGDRRRFFPVFGNRCRNIIVDDVDDQPYADFVARWANNAGRPFHMLDERVALIMEAA